MLEGELECQFRLEALPDAEVRPELMRVGLANVRFFSASPALPALTSQQTFDLYLSLIPPFLSVPHIFF
jgi:hypothetical protein